MDRPTAAANLFDHILDLFEDLVGVSASCFYLVAEDGRAFGHVLRGFDYAKLPAYNSSYHRLDPCHPRRFVNSDTRIVTLHSLISEVYLERSAYYREFMAPLNMHYETDVFFRTERSIVAGVSLIRSRALGNFTAEEIRILRGLSKFIDQLVQSRLFVPAIGESWHPDMDDDFTSRERDVIALLRSGLSNQDIARSLGIRLPTVKSHLQSAFAKAGVGSRTALISKLSGPACSIPTPHRSPGSGRHRPPQWSDR